MIYSSETGDNYRIVAVRILNVDSLLIEYVNIVKVTMLTVHKVTDFSSISTAVKEFFDSMDGECKQGKELFIQGVYCLFINKINANLDAVTEFSKEQLILEGYAPPQGLKDLIDSLLISQYKLQNAITTFRNKTSALKSLLNIKNK